MMGLQRCSPISIFCGGGQVEGMDIRIARIRAGLRQYELAERAGVRQSELSLIENGRLKPSAPKAERIARALSIDVAETRGVPAA